ncbi:MAG TPA: hypothetical protein DIT96_10525, partial [Pseudomonas sp.]|nr:hypothetical protein [Pseudomonas sp.]
MPQRLIQLLELYLMRTGMLALALGLLSLGLVPQLPSVGWLLLLAAGAVVRLFTRGGGVGGVLLGVFLGRWCAHQG